MWTRVRGDMKAGFWKLPWIRHVFARGSFHMPLVTYLAGDKDELQSLAWFALYGVPQGSLSAASRYADG